MIFDALRWLGLQLGRGPGRRRPARPVPPERAQRDLPRARGESCVRARAPPTPASARASGSTRCARSRRRRSRTSATTATAARCRADEAARRRAAGEAHVRPPGDAARGRDRGRRPAARRGALRQRAGRRPGAAQERRLPDLPPGERGRRPPDGDHPRDPRRGVALLAAQARDALPRLRLGAARLLPPAAAAQRRPLEDLEAQEPGQPQLLPPRRLPARGDAQLPRAHGLGDAGRARGVPARGVRRCTSRSSGSRSAARCSTSRS